MALIDFAIKHKNGTLTTGQYNLADWTAEQMDKVKTTINKQDRDYVMIVDGPERCLSGDTIIRTNRAELGRKHSLKWMYNQFNNNPEKVKHFKQWDLNIPTYVRSFDGHLIRLHKINNVVYSGKQEVYKLELENGNSIKATKEHKIMTDKGFIKLKDLTTKDLIMCDTPNSNKSNKVIAHLNRDINLCGLKYHPEYIAKKKRIKIQQIIWEARINHLALEQYLEILMNYPERTKNLKYIDTTKDCIHHKDFNHYNNDLENLECISKEEHLRIHSTNYKNFNQGNPIFVKQKSITYIGLEDTYDIVCDEPNHNFSANDIICHNSGKTTFATQVAKYVDPTFTQERLCLTPDEFVNQIAKAQKGQCVVFDEAYTGLASSSTMSIVNKLLRELMMEMGKKNLFVIVILPSVFYLEKYVCLHRARALFHTYFSKRKSGQYMVYNQKKLKTLYLFGKRKMSYHYPRVRIKARFPNIQPVDWKAYEERKISALKDKSKPSRREDKLLAQRDTLFYVLSKKFGLSTRKIEGELKNMGLGEKDISPQSISDGIRKIAEEERQKREMVGGSVV